MLRKVCTLGELDEVLAKLGEEDELTYEEILIEEEEGEYAIFVHAMRIAIPDLKIEVREGYYGLYQEDEDYYMPDFSLTAVYQEGAQETDFLMWEQDSPVITLANFTHKSIRELEAMTCILIIEET